MAVGCFLYCQIVPSVGIGIICLFCHVFQEILGCLRFAVEHAVYQRHCFGTSDFVLRTEGTVFIAVYPAVIGCYSDFVLCPVACDIVEACGCFIAVYIETSCDCGEFGTSDGCVGAEGSIGITGNDTHRAQCGYCAAVPSIVAYICEFILTSVVCITNVILKQAEEDSRNLCTGDGVLRSYLAVAVANDVCEVVCVIQTQCIIILDFYGRFFLFLPPPLPPSLEEW